MGSHKACFVKDFNHIMYNDLKTQASFIYLKHISHVNHVTKDWKVQKHNAYLKSKQRKTLFGLSNTLLTQYCKAP